MYKFLLFSFCLIFSCSIINAEEVELIVPLEKTPQWNDFCEVGYENAQYKDTNDIWNIFSFVKAERVKKNYWAQRRESFDKFLKTCNEMDSSAKSNCYQELKQAENQKNALYKQKRELILYESNINKR